MSKIRLIGDGRWILLACVGCLLLCPGSGVAQVFLSNPALRDSPFGPDVTDTRTAGYQVQYVSVDVQNLNGFAVSVPWSVDIDGTIVASATQTVNASSIATFIKGASPAPILTVGAHTITAISGATMVPRNFTVSGGNQQPTNIVLSTTNIAENLPIGTKVGHFTTQDPDVGNTFTYTLVAGTGSGDNGSFTISGSNLVTAAMFNYEVKSNYSIRVQAADQGSLSTQKVFAVRVTDVDETPVFYGPSEPTNGNLVLRWSSTTNKLYTIHHSTNLLTGFSVLQSNIPATPSINSYTQSVLTVPQKFWKITTDQ